MQITDRRNEPPAWPATPEQLKREHASIAARLAAWDRFIAWLHERMPEAVAAQQAYDAEVGRLVAAQREIERGPQSGLWLDSDGRPRSGVDGDAQVRHRQISVRLAELARQRQAWLDEAMRVDESHRGVPRRWSWRHVPSLEQQLVDANLSRAVCGSDLNDAALRLAAAEGA
jgi:hypothetical protein